PSAATPQTQASVSRPTLRVPSASAAPRIPQSPQAAICQGVHGPCPNQKLETSAASAPTAKPAAGPSAYPAKTTMSVVGLTLGKAAKAIRPAIASAASTATRARTWAGGRERSYQAKPPSSTAPTIRKLTSCQLTASPQALPSFSAIYGG